MKTLKNNIFNLGIIITTLIVCIMFNCSEENNDAKNQTVCNEFSSGENIELENGSGKSALDSEIIVDSGVVILDINITIKTKCEEPQCGLDFETMGLYFKDSEGSEMYIQLVKAFAEGGETFTETTFDNEAQDILIPDNKPYVGTYKPVGDLSQLYGKNSNGTWALVFEEPGFRGDLFNTVMDSWSLEICNN